MPKLDDLYSVFSNIRGADVYANNSFDLDNGPPVVKTIRGSKLIGSANLKLNLRLIFNVHLLCFKVTREALAHGAGE